MSITEEGVEHWALHPDGAQAMPKAGHQPLPYSGSQRFSYATKAQQVMLVTENTLKTLDCKRKVDLHSI